MTHLIVDISSNNPHPIDWVQVKAFGIDAAFIKATEGTTYTNPYFATDLAEALSAGLLVAGYHFADFTSATAEAAYFLSVAGQYAKILDDETTANVTWTNDFLAALNKPAVQEMTYGSASSLPQTGIRSFLWPASYGKNYGFGDCWQYTSSATVPGIQGNVDQSEWIGSEADWDAFFVLRKEVEVAILVLEPDPTGQPLDIPGDPSVADSFYVGFDAIVTTGLPTVPLRVVAHMANGSDAWIQPPVSIGTVPSPLAYNADGTVTVTKGWPIIITRPIGCDSVSLRNQGTANLTVRI